VRLDLFNLIDDTLNCLERNCDLYEEALMYVTNSFKMLFSDYNDSIVAVKSRVKSSGSLREKIIRNKYYKKCKKGQEVLDGLSDLLGVMIECRFIKDELRFWDVLKNRFTKEYKDGFFLCPEFENIYLNIGVPQPQIQKNGFLIYRIDGFYKKDDKQINFELQVKSLIHVFWSEIEHEIIYKNNNYTLMDSFMKKMLSTIHNNLVSMDNQLSLIYDQVNKTNSRRNSVNENDFKAFFAVMINDLFCIKMLESMGFTVNFKKTCDILSQYIFARIGSENKIMQQSSFVEFTNRMRYMMKKSINFEECIEMLEEFTPKDDFCRILGTKLLELMNSDYEWNLFFKMLFEIEPLSNMEDFETFIYVIENKFENDKLYYQIIDSEKFEDFDLQVIKRDITIQIAKVLANAESISMIYEKTINYICDRIISLCEDISNSFENIEQWNIKKDYMLKMFENEIQEYFKEA